MQGRAPDLPVGWEKTVRNFVLGGGGAMLIHHSAGYRATASPAFPEVATVDSFVPIRGMKIVADHPVINAGSIFRAFPKDAANPAFSVAIARSKMAKGDTFASGFPDYMTLLPGKAGKVIVESVPTGNLGGDAAVVVGRPGRGRVVLCGVSLGAKCRKVDGKYITTEELTPEEAAILVNSVFWLAE